MDIAVLGLRNEVLVLVLAHGLPERNRRHPEVRRLLEVGAHEQQLLGVEVRGPLVPVVLRVARLEREVRRAHIGSSRTSSLQMGLARGPVEVVRRRVAGRRGEGGPCGRRPRPPVAVVRRLCGCRLQQAQLSGRDDVPIAKHAVVCGCAPRWPSAHRLLPRGPSGVRARSLAGAKTLTPGKRVGCAVGLQRPAQAVSVRERWASAALPAGRFVRLLLGQVLGRPDRPGHLGGGEHRPSRGRARRECRPQHGIVGGGPSAVRHSAAGQQRCAVFGHGGVRTAIDGDVCVVMMKLRRTRERGTLRRRQRAHFC